MGDPLAKRLLGIFAEELGDHVQSLEQALLELEGTGEPAAAPELTEAMFRAAHSLKGAARAVDIGAVESLCHQLESIFAAVRNGQAVFGPALVQLLFSVTIVRRAACAMRGRVEAAFEAGRGTVFTLTLPLRRSVRCWSRQPAKRSRSTWSRSGGCCATTRQTWPGRRAAA
jgi:chemotaxis protein histidine kinase CheA